MHPNNTGAAGLMPRDGGRIRNRSTLVLSSFLFLAGSFVDRCVAHDLWLVPPPGPAPVSKPVEVGVSVGMDFPVSLHAADPQRLSFQAVGPHGQKATVSARKVDEEQRAVAAFVPSSEGTWILSAVTQANRLELEANDFNEYLLHDGLAHVLAKRMKNKEMNSSATERYSKYTKALIDVGGPNQGGAESQPLGLKLEILLLQNPFLAHVGDTLTAQVLFDGQPLKEASLCWDHPGNGEAFSGQTWTDEQGKALIPVARTGLMTLRLVHMTRPRMKEYEWESFWASHTFRIPTVPPGRK